MVVGERGGDMTVSHNKLDLAGSGLRPTRCPLEDINCLPLNSAMAQWVSACDCMFLEVLSSSLASCILFFTVNIYNIRVLDYI